MRRWIGLGLLGAALCGGCDDGGESCDVPQKGLVFLLAFDEQNLDLSVLTPTSLLITHEGTQGIADCAHVCGDARGGGEEAVHCDPPASGMYNISIDNDFAGSVNYDLDIYLDGDLVDQRPSNVPGNGTSSALYTH